MMRARPSRSFWIISGNGRGCTRPSPGSAGLPRIRGNRSERPWDSMYHISRLKNGLTIATAEMPHMASVSLGLWVGVGGRYEPATLNGVSHFIEHLLFKGTRKRSAKEISQAVESIGGYLNAFTGEESTCFYSKGLHGRLEELLE